MSLSEEDPLVSCIAILSRNGSIFSQDNAVEKKRKNNSCTLQLVVLETNRRTNSDLGCGCPATSPGLTGDVESALLKVKANNFPAHQMHSVKLVWRLLGEVEHMPTRPFESNHASPPK